MHITIIVHTEPQDENLISFSNWKPQNKVSPQFSENNKTKIFTNLC